VNNRQLEDEVCSILGKHPLVRSAYSMMMRWEVEPQHTLHVAKQAMRIAVALRSRIYRHQRAWPILEAASLLHDIGWRLRPDGKGHHKASEQMILQEKWPEELRDYIHSVAAVARYHRKRGPSETDATYSQLNDEEKLCVRQMAGILRLADALDREHRQHYEVHSIVIQDDAAVKIYVTGPSGIAWMAVENAWNKKKDLAESSWNMLWGIERMP
jgi:exopolyphosphatase/guanosine-5'-triphosphate,3'-diphosphate pyrophosphatase